MPRPMRPPWGHPVPPVWRGSDYKEEGLGGTLLTQVEAMEGAAQKEGEQAGQGPGAAGSLGCSLDSV